MAKETQQMSPEELVEELLLLPEAEQAHFFGLVRQRPILQRLLAGESSPRPEPELTTPVIDSTADYLLIFDGGSKGNPGQGYGSYHLSRPSTGKGRTERLEFSGRMTNNEAEYETLVNALETLLSKIREFGKDPRDYSIEIRGDSQLVIFQILGKWKAKDDRMAAYRDRARKLLKQFGTYELKHHLRDNSVRVLGH
jgi:ribonuclease HI